MGRERRLAKRFSVRYRYLFSFLLVALIPISIILIFFYHYNLEELRRDVEDINMSRVSQIKAGFEREIANQLSLSNALCDNQNFLSLLQRDRPADRYDARMIFNEYDTYRNLSASTAVLVLDKNQVYSRSGCSSCAVFFTDVLQLDLVQAEILLASLDERLSNTFSEILPMRKANGQEVLICLYSMPGYSTTPSAIFMAVMEYQQIVDEFEPVLSRFRGSAFIMNKDGEVVFQTNEDESPSGATLMLQQTANLEGETQGQIPITDEGAQYSILYSRSEKSGLTYGVIAEEDLYVTQVIKQTTLIWQIALMALVVCFIVIVLLTLFNYLPVKKLMALTGSLGRSGNEYGLIQQAIIDNTTKADRLEIELARQRPFVIEKLLGYALYSETSTEQISQLFQNMNIGFEHPVFFVMCVRALGGASKKQESSHFKTTVIDYAASAGSKEFSCFCVERFDENEVIVTVNCRDGLDEKACALEFRGGIAELLGKTSFFTIGVGSLCCEIGNLKRSLYEATMLVENCMDRPISYMEELEEEPEGGFPCLYPVKDVMLFQLQLKQGDEDNAWQTFERLLEFSQEQCRSLLVSKFLKSYIINALVEVLQQPGNNPDFGKQIRQLMQARSNEEFQQAASALITEFCKMINEGKRNTNTRLRDQILTYIQEHIADVDLGLESIGESFGLSPYYVSRLFRDQNNMNLKDYISELRMERAKELLITSDRPVSDIVEAVGYISASSFIRKFKLAEGMTPGEYRKRCGNGFFQA